MNDMLEPPLDQPIRLNELRWRDGILEQKWTVGSRDEWRQVIPTIRFEDTDEGHWRAAATAG